MIKHEQIKLTDETQDKTIHNTQNSDKHSNEQKNPDVTRSKQSLRQAVASNSIVFYKKEPHQFLNTENDSAIQNEQTTITRQGGAFFQQSKKYTLKIELGGERTPTKRVVIIEAQIGYNGSEPYYQNCIAELDQYAKAIGKNTIHLGQLDKPITDYDSQPQIERLIEQAHALVLSEHVPDVEKARLVEEIKFFFYEIKKIAGIHESQLVILNNAIQTIHSIESRTPQSVILSNPALQFLPKSAQDFVSSLTSLDNWASYLKKVRDQQGLFLDYTLIMIKSLVTAYSQTELSTIVKTIQTTVLELEKNSALDPKLIRLVQDMTAAIQLDPSYLEKTYDLTFTNQSDIDVFKSLIKYVDWLRSAVDFNNCFSAFRTTLHQRLTNSDRRLAVLNKLQDYLIKTYSSLPNSRDDLLIYYINHCIDRCTYSLPNGLTPLYNALLSTYEESRKKPLSYLGAKKFLDAEETFIENHLMPLIARYPTKTYEDCVAQAISDLGSRFDTNYIYSLVSSVQTHAQHPKKNLHNVAKFFSDTTTSRHTKLFKDFIHQLVSLESSYDKISPGVSKGIQHATEGTTLTI